MQENLVCLVVFNKNGEHVPVTILRIENVEVLSVKSIDKDGYTAVQLGFCNKKSKNISKPLKGVFASQNLCLKRKLLNLELAKMQF